MSPTKISNSLILAIKSGGMVSLGKIYITLPYREIGKRVD
jgi:hypothetical protein